MATGINLGAILSSRSWESPISPHQIILAALAAVAIGLFLKFAGRKRNDRESCGHLLFLGSGIALFLLALLFAYLESRGPME